MAAMPSDQPLIAEPTSNCAGADLGIELSNSLPSRLQLEKCTSTRSCGSGCWAPLPGRRTFDARPLGLCSASAGGPPGTGAVACVEAGAEGGSAGLFSDGRRQAAVRTSAATQPDQSLDIVHAFTSVCEKGKRQPQR